MSFKTIFATSALAASSLVNAAVLPIRQAPSTGPTCEGKAVDTTFRTKLASNSQFEVVCGADHFGGDLPNGLVWPGSFEGCLAACDAEPLCGSVSWTNGPCYLKSGVPALIKGNDAVWTAKKNPPPTCEGSASSDGAYYASAAGNFEIICGKDYGGNDLGGIWVDSFAACIDHCAADQRCVDVSYEYGACYPKNALGDLSVKGSVWTAKFLGTRGGASPSPVASPSPTPEVAKALSCIDGADNNKHYLAQTTGDFTIECGVDHWGADIGAVPTTTTFEQCMDACETQGECVAVSWVWGSCYMKNAINPGQTGVGHVWGAVRAARAPAVASDAAVTPTPTPTPTPVAELAVTPVVDSASTPAPTPAAVDPVMDVVSSPTPTPSVTPTEELPSLPTTE